MTDSHTYLCDIPAPDQHGRITWACAICAFEASRAGKPLGRPVPVTVKRVRLSQRWVNVPTCAEHEDGTEEQRQGATMFMLMEETFERCGGGAITEKDIAATMAHNEEHTR